MTANKHPPDEFVYLDSVVPGILTDIRYARCDNFTGAPLPGYRGGRAILTHKAAEALQAVRDEARATGWMLLLWDAYRPQRAVDAFLDWRDTPCDPVLKSVYYPDLAKKDLFTSGLIASPSSHSRGSTVDLTLVSTAQEKRLLDTGGFFDLFAASSATDYSGLSPVCRASRRFLRELMDRHGFDNLPSEWWHYTLRDEPFPETYFDFEVRDDWPQMQRDEAWVCAR